MDRLQSIGEVAEQLGLSVDVVRSLTESGQLKAVRTDGGHRRYRPEEVERFKKTRRPPAKKPPPERPTRKPPRPADLEEPDFKTDAATLEDLEAEIARQQVIERAEVERQRLEGLKKYGRDLALWTLLPTDVRVQVYEDLEEFVTSKRVLPSLSVSEAQLIVSARVQQVAKQYRDAENQRLAREREAADQRRRAEEERRQKEREAEEQRRKQENEAAEQLRKQQEDERKLKALIDHGNNHAWCETINGWDRSEADRACRDVARALKDEVKVDWTEDEVDDLVDDVLDDGDEDEDEEDEEEEGDESW